MQALNNFPVLDSLMQDSDTIVEAVVIHITEFIIQLPFYDQMVEFFTGVCMQICAMLDIADSYFSILFERFQESKYQDMLMNATKQIISLELVVAKVETIGYGFLFSELARLLAGLVDHYVPKRYQRQLYRMILRIEDIADGLEKAGEGIDIEQESLGASIDLEGAAFWVRKAITCIVSCIKAHSTQILLNAIFSIIAGQIWNTNSSHHLKDTLKIFFTNLAAYEFIHGGVHILRKIKQWIHQQFVDMFEPFENYNDNIANQELVEKLMAF